MLLININWISLKLLSRLNIFTKFLWMKEILMLAKIFTTVNLSQLMTFLMMRRRKMKTGMVISKLKLKTDLVVISPFCYTSRLLDTSLICFNLAFGCHF